MSREPTERIVVELDPELKLRLYAALREDEQTMKAWLTVRIWEYLNGRTQPPLPFDLPPFERR